MPPSSNPVQQHFTAMTRRHFFAQTGLGLGTAALGNLVPGQAVASGGQLAASHLPGKAKRAIYLFMAGGPLPDGYVRLQTRHGRLVQQGTP